MDNDHSLWFDLLIMIFVLGIVVSTAILIITGITNIVLAFKHPNLTLTQIIIMWLSDKWGWLIVQIGSYIGLVICSSVKG